MEAEFLTECGNFRIDAALPASRIAIDVDGPSHFVRGAEGRPRPNGNTLLRRRLLEASGWRVVSVPYFEWDKARASGGVGFHRLQRLPSSHPPLIAEDSRGIISKAHFSVYRRDRPSEVEAAAAYLRRRLPSARA